MLDPLTSNESTFDNSYTFVSSLKQFEGHADNLFIASFDVDNLYTNVSIYEIYLFMLSLWIYLGSLFLILLYF